MDCYCDYDPPSIFQASAHIAKKEHRCTECGYRVKPGEKYEYVWGIWDGRADTFKTCKQCVNLREYVKAHIPCLCWSYGNMHEDCIEAAQEYAREAPGLLFGAYRRKLLIEKAARSRA